MTKPVQEIRRDFVIAAWNGMIGEVRATLGANPDAVTWVDPRSGATALHCAANQCRADIILLLLEKGATVNARDDDGMTPLMHAAGNGGATHLQPLLDAGADIGLKDERDRTALDHAEEHAQPRNADLIRAHARKIEEKRLLEEQARHAAEVDGAAAQMHNGAAKPVTVRKPLQLKI